MKVYIPPYGTRYTVHKFQDWVMAKKYGQENYWKMDDKDYTNVDKFVEKSCDFVTFILDKTINKITDRERKPKIKIHNYDTWSMDYTLSIIILPMLNQLRDTKHGSPYIDVEDAPTIDKGEDDGYGSDTKIHDRWTWVLDEIIWTFEQLVNQDANSQFHSGESDIYWEKKEDGTSEMKLGPNDTHKYDKEGHAVWNDRIENGLRLFGKYYRELWD